MKKILLCLLIVIFSYSVYSQNDSIKTHKFNIELKFPVFNLKAFSPTIQYDLTKLLSPFIGFEAAYNDYIWIYQLNSGIKFFPYKEKHRLVFSHQFYYHYGWSKAATFPDRTYSDFKANYIYIGSSIEIRIIQNLYSGFSFNYGFGTEKDGSYKHNERALDLYFNIRYKFL